ncbi:hypothetical protein MGH68_10090 [Erysipelothrix sp. D19-032]
MKHIERTRVLVHVVDMGAEDGRDPVEDYRVINEELEKYDATLMNKPMVVVANKMDLEVASVILNVSKPHIQRLKSLN